MKTIFTPVSTPTKSPTGETAYWAFISPEDAENVLETRNTRNRTVKGLGKITALARDIESGSFDLNGETIKFHSDGSVNDGQHRLFSVVKSGKGIHSLVVENLAEGTQATVDLVSKRSAHDQLAFEGIEHSAVKSAVAKNLLIHQVLGVIVDTGTNGFIPSETEIVDYVRENDEVLEHSYQTVRLPWSKSGLRLFTPAVVGALHVLTYNVFPDDADEFFGAQVVRGFNVEEGTASAAVRNFNKLRKLKSLEQDGYLTKAWNHFITDTPMTRLREPKGGWNKNNIPSLILS